jgi:hypothetical protein
MLKAPDNEWLFCYNHENIFLGLNKDNCNV